MIEVLSYGFMQKALFGGIMIAIATSLLGPFLVLRRLSLMGDGLAHLTFGGIALGLLFHFNPLLVAMVTAVIGSFFVQRMVKKNLFGDAAIALILSFGVGLGITVTGAVRGFNVDLFTYLIGSILTLSNVDMLTIGIVTFCVIVFAFIFYKKMVFSSFNSELASLNIKNYRTMDMLFTILIALTVVISIKAVGILLVSALLVMPSLVGLRLSYSFKSTMLIAVLCSICVVVFGIIASFYLDLPPSGIIVMLLFAMFIVAYLFRK